MKIDIHTHTRQCKSGDAPSREIAAADFCEAVRETDVGIIAVTNHNVFDLEQFEDILEEMNGDAQGSLHLIPVLREIPKVSQSSVIVN